MFYFYLLKYLFNLLRYFKKCFFNIIFLTLNLFYKIFYIINLIKVITLIFFEPVLLKRKIKSNNSIINKNNIKFIIIFI